jgi:hypothetical protein
VHVSTFVLIQCKNIIIPSGSSDDSYSSLDEEETHTNNKVTGYDILTEGSLN